MPEPNAQSQSPGLRIELKSNETFLDLSQQAPQLFRKVLIQDSLINFFPYCEFYFRDLSAIVAEHAFFIEGLEFNLKLGTEGGGYLDHDFVWTENQFNDTVPTSFLTGTNTFLFLSKYYKKDYKKSRSWKDTLTNVAKDIALNDYGIVLAKQKISQTTGNEYWYQCNEITAQRVQGFAERAQAQNNPKAPFYCFINSAGEFYFMSLEDLMTQRPLSIRYRMAIGRDIRSDLSAVQAYDIMHGGMPINKFNYKKKVYKYDESANSLSVDTNIVDHVKKLSTREKLLIRRGLRDNYSDYINYGICYAENATSFQGWINSLYRDSSLGYRMMVTVPFNKEIASGRTIEMSVDSSDAARSSNYEMGGNWLIIQSKHYYDQAAAPFSEMLLAKSAIEISNRHRFFSEFL